MEYNTTREQLPIKEYGRNIKKMIEYAVSVEDREKRNKLAKAIVSVMSQLNPQMRDNNEFKHKLWDHLFILSNFKLDVDSPFPIPSQESIDAKPEKISYPSYNISFKHYGKNIEKIIKKIVEKEDGPQKDALTIAIANHMKKSYLNWNRESVDDEVILQHLEMLSEGKLKLKEEMRLNNTRDILAVSKRRDNYKSQQQNPKRDSNRKNFSNNYQKNRNQQHHQSNQQQSNQQNNPSNNQQNNQSNNQQNNNNSGNSNQ
ncbi:MAG TPA: DUF4290 domain-containing protein [Bacteroidales bacterium]|nr:DUF4290 domain-containing protein [Bacteroidales bacterium]HPS17734.1 DUF4290 domain-containing protein [Bacteroidales bacterium]